MSRPVGEPSVPLTQARQGYGVRQLQRRPVIGSETAEFGAATQEIFLPAIGNFSNNCADPLIGSSMIYTLDVTAPGGGGYVTRVTPDQGSYFEFDILLTPQNAIFALGLIFGRGPDYGKFTISIASLLYQSELRPSGCPAGKIQPCDGSYGDDPVFFDLDTQDAYSVAPTYEVYGQLNLIPGGNVGDPLTDLTDVGNPCADNTGLDPLLGMGIMDGGPGWYRVRVQVNDKNASSTDYRCRIVRFACVRLNDTGAI